MLEETSEVGESAEFAALQVGDSVTAFTYPLTEGLIVARRMTEESRLELTLIVAPYKKKGQTWSRATVVTRDAVRLSKKMPLVFNFPIKNVEVLRAEAKKAKGESACAFATCVTLDREFCGNPPKTGTSESEETEEEDFAGKGIRKINNPGGMSESEALEKKQDQLNARVEEVIQLKERHSSKSQKEKERNTEISSDSEAATKKKVRTKVKKRKKRKSGKKKKIVSSSGDSDSSSSPSSDSSQESAEVGERGRTGRFNCPFHEEDCRGFRDIKRQIKGQTVIRKHMRVALHNLYAEHHTLASFADALISKANASPYKPFSSDKAWFVAYARNIDAILLSSLEGPRALWNEPVLDEMVVGFLDLIVRVCPNKEYPMCLDDSVRKWMKKKRVGANPKYGPVSYTLQQAKFTDSGPQVFQPGWQKQKERVFNKSSAVSSTIKGQVNTSGGGEKKPPPPPQA